MKSLQSLFIIALSISLTGCINSVGPQGPEGPPGADGVQIYTSTITIFADDFVVLDEFSSVNEFNWNILDEETVDYGLVMGYLRFDGETAWHALPFSVPFENDLVNLRYVFDIDSFDLVVEGEVANNNDANEAIFDGDDLRVVAIPPNLILKGKGIDYRNYEAVAELYGLED